jgi:hypothetical protein
VVRVGVGYLMRVSAGVMAGLLAVYMEYGDGVYGMGEVAFAHYYFAVRRGSDPYELQSTGEAAKLIPYFYFTTTICICKIHLDDDIVLPSGMGNRVDVYIE